MVKTLTALSAAGLIAAATLTVPTKAEAHPAWVIPAIVVGGVGLLALGAIATGNANAYAYSPRGTVYVQPRAVAASNCSIVRERTAGGGWRRVQICN